MQYDVEPDRRPGVVLDDERRLVPEHPRPWHPAGVPQERGRDVPVDEGANEPAESGESSTCGGRLRVPFSFAGDPFRRRDAVAVPSQCSEQLDATAAPMAERDGDVHGAR